MAHCASNLIVINSIDELRNIKKKRPDRETIIKFAGKEYGLSAEDTLNSLQSLILSKSIYVKTKRGKESFFVDMLQDDPTLSSEDKETNIDKTSNLCEKPSDSCVVRPSESSHHEQEPQAGNGKVRKISSDEERLFELRTELTEKAARQEEHTEISAEEVDSDDTESLSNDSDSAHSQESEIKFRAPNMNLGVTSDRTEYRLSEIEKKLEKIEARLDKNENNKNSDDISRHMVYEDLVAKEIKLEKENQSLKDENYCLKLKILELSKIIENQQKKLNFDISSAQAQILNPQCAPQSTVPHNTLRESDGWKFQRSGARPRQQPTPTSFVTQNRFNVLATEEENVIPTDSFGMNFNISQPFAVSQTFTKSKNSKNEHSAKNQKNLVPGERSYAQVSQREAQHAEGLGASKAPLQQRDSRSRDSQTNRRDNQANRKPTVSIVGDSMLRRLRKQDVNREASHIKTFIKTFPGATIEHMQSYLEPTISMSPDGVIILCGTNNLKKEPPDITANKLIDLAVSTKRKVRQVAVSSIIHRGDSKELEMKRRQVNRLVEIGLSGTGIEFITHDNIDETHLDEWGLHLNFRGGNVLANNLINFLNET